MNFLNEGGSVNDLETQLRTVTWETHVAEADINGDKIPEVVVTIDFNIKDSISGKYKEHDSAALILQCEAGKYEIIFEETGGTLGFLHYSPIVADYNNDGNVEVIFEWIWDGSASEMHPQMISWTDSLHIYDFEDPEGERQLCCPSQWSFDDLDNDGINEVIVKRQTVGHVGLGLEPHDIT